MKMGETQSSSGPSAARARPSRPAFISTALAVLLACIVLLLRLGHRPLVAWDEGIYAEVSREMLGGSWLVPHWNAQLWFEKPPLMLWVTALMFKLFGVHEFTARAASALSGVALVGLLHGWLRRRSGELAAWLNTLMLLSTFAFLHVCSLGELDVPLSLACTVSLLGLVKVEEHALRGWYWFWFGFAAALIIKGAAGIVLLLTLVLVVFVQRWKRDRLRLPFFAGLVLFLVLVMPWHLYMLHRFGAAFLHEYLCFHVLQRATGQIEGHQTHWWYYFGVLLASAAPWVLLYPFAIVQSFRRSEYRALRIFSMFALTVICFFTVVQTRLPHYIASAYPALTIVSAVYLAEHLRALGIPKLSAAVRVGWVLAAIAVWGLCAWLTDAPRKGLHSAKLARGAAASDNREMAALLKDLRRHPGLPGGPLLVWREAASVPIAPVVFYAQRPVQQVQLTPVPPDTPRDKYLFDPEQLSAALAAGPRLVLLDSNLLPDLSPGYTYTRVEAGQTQQIGLIGRSAASRGQASN